MLVNEQEWLRKQTGALLGTFTSGLLSNMYAIPPLVHFLFRAGLSGDDPKRVDARLTVLSQFDNSLAELVAVSRAGKQYTAGELCALVEQLDSPERIALLSAQQGVQAAYAVMAITDAAR